MQASVTLDTTVPVTEGAFEIVKTLLEAIALVVLVIFIFLQNWRATLIPILTIPVSLVGAFMFFPAVGFSVNTLSLLGLVLAVGLVVDDAIVVVEAIEAKIEQGRSPRDAAVEAMAEVGGALVGIALVLSAVFLPAGIHPRHLGIAVPTIRADDRILSAALRLQCSHAESCARRADPEAAQHDRVARAARAYLFGKFNAGFARAQNGYITVSDLLIRRVVLAVIDFDRFRSFRRRSSSNSAHVFSPGRRSGLFFHQRTAARGGFAAANCRGDEEDRWNPEK